MARTICAALRQAILSRGFLIGTLGTALVLLLSSVQGILSGFRSEQLLSPGFHSDFVMSALSSEAMALTLPILCALPYTASFIDDVKSGFIKEYLPRTTVSRYIAGKAVACAWGFLSPTAFQRCCFCPWRLSRRLVRKSPATSAASWKLRSCSSPPAPCGRSLG